MDVIYKAPDGRTQVVMDFEHVKAQILTKLGWKPVPEEVPVEIVSESEQHRPVTIADLRAKFSADTQFANESIEALNDKLKNIGKDVDANSESTSGLTWIGEATPDAEIIRPGRKPKKQ